MPEPGPLQGPKRRRLVGAVLASLVILGSGWFRSGRSAEVLEIRLDGLEVPIDLVQLEAWTHRADATVPPSDELGAWLDLLDGASRRDLVTLLKAPLLRDRSFGRQLLDSWAGDRMMVALGDLLTAPDGSSTAQVLQATLAELLEQREQVSTIELLRALPLERISLQLDGLLQLAHTWHRQLGLQKLALQRLRQLPLPERQSRPLVFSEDPPTQATERLLPVPHRPGSLPLAIWPAAAPTYAGRAGARPWVLMMPGLGGNADQLGWLAAVLADRGWSTVVLQHPGSDDVALKASLEGNRPPPGAETLTARLKDVQAVLAAQRRGELGVKGEGVVLMGHSLGGLTALMAAGLEPEPGLERRCGRRLDRLPITNPSRLLQCQLPGVGLPQVPPAPADLRGVVLYNGFGNLLWPRRGLGSLPVPVLMVGGSLDLVTPPLQEQLELFLPGGDGRSRLVLVDGGSHFSPVRMNASDQAVFQLGEELVGVEPKVVQGLLLRLTTEFLYSLEQPVPLMPQRRQQQGVTAYVLDASQAGRWSGLLPRRRSW